MKNTTMPTHAALSRRRSDSGVRRLRYKSPTKVTMIHWSTIGYATDSPEIALEKVMIPTIHAANPAVHNP